MSLTPKNYNNSNKILFYLCVIIWSMDSLVRIFWVLMNKLFHIPYEFSLDYLMPSIIIALCALSLPAIIARINKMQLGLYLLFTSLFYLSLVIHPNNVFLNEISSYFPITILTYIFVGSLFNIHDIKKVLQIIAVLAVINDSFFLFVFRNNSSYELIESGEYMTAAYVLLPNVLVLTWKAFENPKIKNIMLSAYSMFLLLSYGNRGSVVCVLFFIMAYVTIVHLKTLKNWQRISLFAILSTLYYYMNIIIIFIQGLLASFGFSTRIFDLLLEEEIGTDNSTQKRLDYYDIALKGLDNGDVIGYGMAGDRLLLNGSFSHNIIIESIVSYGYVFGTLFLLMISALIMNAFRRLKHHDEMIFFFLLLCIGFVPLFISGSYVDSIHFYMFLGYCTFIIKKHNISHV